MKAYIEPPIKVDQIIEITIEEIGNKGDGLGRIKGYVVFVPKTEKGVTYTVKITKVNERVGFGEIAQGEE